VSKLVAMLRKWVISTNRKWIAAGLSMSGMERRDQAFDVVAKHGLDAHLYLAASGVNDRELADALRFLSDRGYVVTDRNGNLVGKVAKAQLTPGEAALERRAKMYLIVDNK